MMMRPKLRFRINANGFEVWNAGKWISADDAVIANTLLYFERMFTL